jgi:hypothetical protein
MFALDVSSLELEGECHLLAESLLLFHPGFVLAEGLIPGLWKRTAVVGTPART